MEFLLTVGAIIACILLFSFAIFIHEFGHFVAAKLLGLRVDEGEHTIVMRYEPLGLRLGTEVSVCALLLLLLGLLLYKRRQKRNAFTVTTPRVQSIEEIPSVSELCCTEDEESDGFALADDVWTEDTDDEQDGFIVLEETVVEEDTDTQPKE